MPELGISLEALGRLAQDLGCAGSPTWSELVRSYIAPSTLKQEPPCPFIDLLPDADVGPPSFYLVYRSIEPVQETVKAVAHHLHHHNAADTYIWIDVLCTNLHPDNKEQLVSPFTRAAEAISDIQDVLVVCGTHGEWATRGWMLWEIWFAAFTCGRAALHFVAAGGRCAARDLALYAQRIDLSAAAWSGPGDALKMKEWMESHHGSNALYLATTRLRLLMLLNADDSHLSLLQQRMVTQRLHELGNSVMNGCPVPEPTATVQGEAPTLKRGVGWGRGGVAPDGTWAPDPAGGPTPSRYLQWLSLPFTDPRARLLVIAGDSGTGKSGAAATLCNSAHPPAAAILCQRQDSTFHDSVRVVRSVAYQMAMSCPAFAPRLLTSLDAESVWEASNPEQAVRTLLTQPLTTLATDLEAAGIHTYVVAQAEPEDTDTPKRGSSPSRAQSPTRHMAGAKRSVGGVTPAPAASSHRDSPEQTANSSPRRGISERGISERGICALSFAAGAAPQLGRVLSASPRRAAALAAAQAPGAAAATAALRQVPPHGLVVLIDGLDDGCSRLGDGVGVMKNEVLTLLRDHLMDLPPWVRFVVTCDTRLHPHLLAALTTLQPAMTGPHELYRLQEIQVSIARHIVRRVGTARGALTLAQQLLSHTKGDFFLCRLYARLISLGKIPFQPNGQLSTDKLPASRQEALTALLKAESHTLTQTHTNTSIHSEGAVAGSSTPPVLQLLQVLVAARQPLDTGLIDTLGLTDALSQLPAHGTLFYTDHHTLYTVHPYVIEYLMDKETAGTWYADVAKGHRQLATALLPYAMDPSLSLPYATQHTLAHAALAGMISELETLVQNLYYWEKVYAAGVGRGVLRDLHNLAPADNVIITDVSRWLRDAHTVLTLHPHAAHQLARDAPTCSVLHRAAHTHTEHANTTTDTMTVDAARADLVGSRSEWAPLLCEASVAPRAVTALAVPSEPGALPVVAVCVSGGEVVLWSLRQCRQVGRLRGHTRSVDYACFVPDSHASDTSTTNTASHTNNNKGSASHGGGGGGASGAVGQAQLLVTYSSAERAVRIWSLKSISEIASVTGMSFTSQATTQELHSAGHVDFPADDRRFFVRLYPDMVPQLRETQRALTAQRTQRRPQPQQSMARPASRDDTPTPQPTHDNQTASTGDGAGGAVDTSGRATPVTESDTGSAVLTTLTKASGPRPTNKTLARYSEAITRLTLRAPEFCVTTSDDTHTQCVLVSAFGGALHFWDRNQVDTMLQTDQEASSADTAHGRMLSLWTDTTASHTDTDTATAPHNGSQNMPAVRAAVADVSGKGPVRVLEGTSGAHVSTLPHEDNIQVLCVATSPDGHWVASGASDNVIRVWDTHTLHHTHTTPTDHTTPSVTLTGHTAPVTTLAFISSGTGLPDGYHLVSGSVDESIRVWNLSAAQSPPGSPGAAGRVGFAAAHSVTHVHGGGGDQGGVGRAQWRGSSQSPTRRRPAAAGAAAAQPAAAAVAAQPPTAAAAAAVQTIDTQPGDAQPSDGEGILTNSEHLLGQAADGADATAEQPDFNPPHKDQPAPTDATAGTVTGAGLTSRAGPTSPSSAGKLPKRAAGAKQKAGSKPVITVPPSLCVTQDALIPSPKVYAKTGLSPKVTTTTPTGAKCLAKLEATRRFDHISTELPQHTAEQVARKQAQRRVALLDGHEGGVVCLACSHFQIASGGNDHSVRLWRCKSRLWRLECVLGSHPGPVTSATFAQSGEWLASGSHRTHTGQRYGVVKVWHLSSLTLSFEVTHSSVACWLELPLPPAAPDSPQRDIRTRSAGGSVSSAAGQNGAAAAQPQRSPHRAGSHTAVPTANRPLLAICSTHCIDIRDVTQRGAGADVAATSTRGEDASNAARADGVKASAGDITGQDGASNSYARSVARVYSVQPLRHVAYAGQGVLVTSDGLHMQAFHVRDLV